MVPQRFGAKPFPSLTTAFSQIRADVPGAGAWHHEYAEIWRDDIPAIRLRIFGVSISNSVLPSPGEAARKFQRKQLGFTLLELLVVLAILGLLIGLVAPAALRQLGSAKEKVAHQSIERLSGVLDIYKLDVGTYPTTEQGLQALITKPAGVARWNGPYLKGEKLPEDPWGRPYVYRNPSQRPGREYDLLSLGPTGQPGGTAETIANE
jgi:general secretion pathway protein G